MKTVLLLLSMVLCSCGSTTSYVESTTTHGDGSTTTVKTPVMSPKDSAFMEQCKLVQEAQF